MVSILINQIKDKKKILNEIAKARNNKWIPPPQLKVIETSHEGPKVNKEVLDGEIKITI